MYIPFFQASEQKIQQHGNDAENENGEDHPVKFEHLAAIDDHIAQPLLGSDEFSDDDADQTQTDVDFHDREQIRDVGGQYNLEQYMHSAAVERADELDFIR